jgi:hypothetical protein
MLREGGVFVIDPDDDLGVACGTILSSPQRTSGVLLAEDYVRAYSGMFPCLRFGVSTRLVFSVSRARISFGRVSWGMITSSM